MSSNMKFSIAVIAFVLCFASLTVAQRNCPQVCPSIYSPVCGAARVGGRNVRCQFPSPCAMTANGCRNNINWRTTSCSNLSSCNGLV